MTLNLLFDWLDGHAAVYGLGAAAATAAVLATIVAGFRNENSGEKSRRGEVWFAVVIVVLLFAWRWPFLLKAHELDQDENQFIAGAITLTHDPVFWRSVDGTTSGPLNFYVLLGLRLVGLSLDCFGARLVGLVLVATSLIACYRLFRSQAGTTPARLALLPPLFFFATTTDYEFVHYTSEHVSLALFALAAYWLMRRRPPGETDKWGLALGGFCVGLLPWAKIQTAPLMAALLAYRLWLIFGEAAASRAGKGRQTGLLLFASAAPSLFAAAALLVTGEFGDFFRGYILLNLVYAAGGGETIGKVLQAFAEVTARTKSFPAFFCTTLAIVIAGGVLLVRQRRRPGALFLAGAACTVAGAVCILTPHRSFEHYLLLAVIPLAIWSGAAVMDSWPSLRFQRAAGIGLLLLGLIVPLGFRLLLPKPAVVGKLGANHRDPYSVPGAILRVNAEPGDSLGVWGWQAELFVDSGLPQATRDPHIYWLIADSPYREYYRARYLADLRRSRPAFFVDAVGPGSFNFFDRKTVAHESFPELAAFIARDYSLLVDLGVERIYVRADLPAVTRTPAPDTHRTRTAIEVDAGPPESVLPATLGKWDIDGRGVQMLLPPGRVAWALDGTERQLVVEYGFHPRAYTEGHSNGADFIVDLQAPDGSQRSIFRRRLDPARQPADRGILQARFTLPPLSAGTRLVVRTEAGDYGDEAWDWLFLASARFVKSRRFLPEQFPGFARVPDSAEANHAALLENAAGKILILHAPSMLSYRLQGSERRLGFAYGLRLQPTVATGGGTFVVALHSGTAPGRVLFQRRLDPAHADGDRGRQQAEVAIPAANAGDTLALRIEGDGSAAGNGAYVSELRFD